jgi:hypothetical protein
MTKTSPNRVAQPALIAIKPAPGFPITPTILRSPPINDFARVTTSSSEVSRVIEVDIYSV